MSTAAYFSTQSAFTDPGDYSALFQNVPKTIPGICGAVQRVLLDYEERYKYPIPNERLLDTNSRYVRVMLQKISKMDKNPLTEARLADRHFMASDSDFVSLFLSIARSYNIPARKRTGFVSYLPKRGGAAYRYHEIAEYFDEATGKWLKADPFLDDIAIKANNITFDPYNLPDDKFIPAGQAWLDAAAGKLNPSDFKSEESSGFDVILQALILDLAAINKRELLGWDRFGWLERTHKELWPDELKALDKLAALLIDADNSFTQLQAVYTSEHGFKVPKIIKCVSPVVPPHRVELAW